MRKPINSPLFNWLCEINPAPDLVQKDIYALARMAGKLHASYLQSCNGPELTEAERMREIQTENKIIALLNGFGLTVQFNSDPRGPALRITNGKGDRSVYL